MGRKLLMLKDTPVLVSSGFDIEILDLLRLPLQLRSEDVDFDRVFHGWQETRVMNMGRTNADMIMAGFRMSRTNSFEIAAKMHFATLTDCYWMKDESENITWNEVSLYRISFSPDVAETSLFGKSQIFRGRIHTPETSTGGLSAKAWYRAEDGTLWMYKIGKKELAASEILDQLGASHVRYYDASDELPAMADEEHIRKIQNSGEKLVKSRIITSEERSIADWYDYQEYCEHNGELDPYQKIRNDPQFYDMQVADYILNNPDRHGENWGFYQDADSGELLGLHPLFDHDHAFSESGKIMSQTAEDENMTLRDAAVVSLGKCSGLDLEGVLAMDQPDELSVAEWSGVKARTEDLLRISKSAEKS